MRTPINLETLFFGEEPSWNDPKKEINLNRALSWYANKLGSKESKAYTLDYVKQNKYPKSTIEQLSKSKDWLFCNLGFVCRMISRGANLDKKEWIDFRINEIISKNTHEEVEKKESPTIQDSIFDQTTKYINDLEELVDGIIKTRKLPIFNCYDWLKSNDIKPLYTKHIINHYANLKLELELTINKKDDQLVESYSSWTKKALKDYYTFISSIISSCEDYANNTKITRKRTKKKPVSLEKKVSKVIYKKEDADYKIVSINPTEILSASQLWVFNTKTKKLGIYYSKDESGLSIKGTTLENFDETLSTQKTLRKPLDIIGKIPKGKKTELKKMFKDITSKDSILNGRLNVDTILLRAIK